MNERSGERIWKVVKTIVSVGLPEGSSAALRKKKIKRDHNLDNLPTGAHGGVGGLNIIRCHSRAI